MNKLYHALQIKTTLSVWPIRSPEIVEEQLAAKNSQATDVRPKRKSQMAATSLSMSS